MGIERMGFHIQVVKYLVGIAVHSFSWVKSSYLFRHIYHLNQILQQHLQSVKQFLQLKLQKLYNFHQLYMSYLSKGIFLFHRLY